MDNLELMKYRLGYHGGNQQGRMIGDKHRAFSRALQYSYQGCDVRKLGQKVCYRALINPDKNKKNYDDKILSIDYCSGFKPGDIFEWIGTHTFWIVYLQEYTELAYFRSEIRRCKHVIKWRDGNLLKSTLAYVRGPVETKVNFFQKSGISFDDPNWSLEIYVPKNKDTLAKFKRYDRFMLEGKTWEVQVVDSISQDGVLEIIALEHYTNPTLDNEEHNLTDEYEVLPVALNDEDEMVPIADLVSAIQGETFIKPIGQFTYTIDSSQGNWSIKESNYPVEIVEQTDNSIIVKWTQMTSGQFTLLYTTSDNQVIEKLIVVESLF